MSFTTLRLVYADALANFRPGQTNSVLVITSGPHTDQSLDGCGLQEFIRRAFDPARPVAVNVIDFGDDSDRATWEASPRRPAASYQNLSTSASPDLTSAITDVPRLALGGGVTEDRTDCLSRRRSTSATDETAQLTDHDLPGSAFGGGAASVFCHSWHSLVLNVVSPASICTVCGFLLIALATMPSAVGPLPVAGTAIDRTGGLVDARHDVGSHRIGAVAFEARLRTRRRWRRHGIRVGRADDADQPHNQQRGRDSHSRHQANASTGGHEHIRFRSPYAPSMRRTGGHTLGRKPLPSG